MWVPDLFSLSCNGTLGCLATASYTCEKKKYNHVSFLSPDGNTVGNTAMAIIWNDKITLSICEARMSLTVTML